jgi:carbon starvation protein CstA
VIWRSFSVSTQAWAMLTLWCGASFLARERKNFWIAAVPAAFMSAVTSTYFVMAPECLGLIPSLANNTMVAYPVGILFAVFCLTLFMRHVRRIKRENGAVQSA